MGTGAIIQEWKAGAGRMYALSLGRSARASSQLLLSSEVGIVCIWR